MNTIIIVYDATLELNLFIIDNCSLYAVDERGKGKSNITCIIIKEQDFTEKLQPYLDKHKVIYKIVARNVSNEVKEIVSKVLLHTNTLL